jgi:hypothetical protein
MSNFKTQEYLAKEAESLERAKLTDDEDLKHLHETIAKQWHLLAAGIGTSSVNKRAGHRPTTKRPSRPAIEPPQRHRKRTRSKTTTRHRRSA